MAKNCSADFEKMNADVISFIKEFKPLIFKASKYVGLRRCFWEGVLSEMAERFAEGRIKFDPTRGVKASTYVFLIAECVARDEIRRQHPERFEEMDDRAWENLGDERNGYARLDADDEKLIAMEAIRRLTKQIRDKVKIELLVRFVINKESRQELAREYGVSNDSVSLQKTRYLPRLQQLVRDVWMEDEEGKLKFSSTDISFLTPYVNW